MHIKVKGFWAAFIVALINAADFQIEIVLLLKPTSEVETPYSTLLDHFKVLTFISLHNLILDVILLKETKIHNIDMQ